MSDVPTKIWVLRRGNGKAEVNPSPAVLRYEERFGIRNLTERTVEVVFPPGTIISVPSKGIRARRIKGIRARRIKTIPAGEIAVYRVVARGHQFFEYRVTLPAVQQYAEGGSKPGVIIDP